MIIRRGFGKGGSNLPSPVNPDAEEGPQAPPGLNSTCDAVNKCWQEVNTRRFSNAIKYGDATVVYVGMLAFHSQAGAAPHGMAGGGCELISKLKAAGPRSQAGNVA